MKDNRIRSLKINATLNAIKQICAIIFPIISFAYASRMVGPTGIGIYSFANSIISYHLLLSAIGVRTYAVREGARIRKDQKELERFCNEVFSINIVFTVFAYIILFILMNAWEKLEPYTVALLIQSAAIILTTIGADWINTIFEDYLYLTIRYIIIQIFSILAMVLFVKSSNDLYKYILICLLSSHGGNLFNIYYIRKKVQIRFVFRMNFKKHIVPLMILFCSNIASTVYLQSDITMLRIITDDKTVGIYTVSTKVYSVVKTLVNGLTTVTVPRFSYYLGNQLYDVYKINLEKLLNYILLIVLPLSIGMYMEASNILYIFAGKEYLSGVEVIKILSFSFPFAVGACLFSYAVMMPFKKELYYLFSTTTAAILNIVLNFFLLPKFGMNGASFTTLLAEAVVFCISIIISKGCVDLSIKITRYFPLVISGVLIIVVCLLAGKLIDNLLISTAIAVSCSCCVYAASLILFRYPEAVEIVDIIIKKLRK